MSKQNIHKMFSFRKTLSTDKCNHRTETLKSKDLKITGFLEPVKNVIKHFVC